MCKVEDMALIADAVLHSHRASLPAILNLFMLWFTFFLLFGIVFVEVFSLTRWENHETRNQNYSTFPKTLVMLVLASTG